MRTRRIRLTLLVLLWAWAATVLLVLDLFFNVDALERVRPRVALYRAARHVAHDLVGEPVRDPEPGSEDRPPAARCGTADLARRLAAVPEMDAEELARLVRGVGDSRVRIHAMRTLATEGGGKAREVLVSVARDSAETAKIRQAAAENLGRLGEASAPELEALILLPDAAPGAVRGLSTLGTPWAAQRLAALAGAAPSPIRTVALEALAAISNPAAAAELARLLAGCEDGSTAVAICRALGAAGGAAERPALVACARDRSRSTEERSAAIEALGRIGTAEEVAAIQPFRCDESHRIGEAADLAVRRIRHRRSPQ